MTPDDLAFRPAAEADKDFLWTLRQQTMRAYVEPVRGWDESAERGYAHDLDGCWIIEHAGRPSGAFQVKRWPEELHLSRMQIEPQFQGRGWGTRVVRHVQHEIASRQPLPLTLQVLSNNPALRLYERLGFEVTSQHGNQIKMRWRRPASPDRWPADASCTMMNLLKPRRLSPGGTVAAVSLSWGGPGTFPHRYQAGKAQLEQTFGLRVVESKHALRDPQWLAANPKARADDLMESFADPAISAVISTIGGDDSVRILPYLDLAILRDNPKVFLGYSDTTVTHFACLRAGLVSFYGPAIMAGFGENAGIFPYTVDSVRRTLFSPEPVGRVDPAPAWTVEHLTWADPANQSRARRLTPSPGWRFLQGRGRATGPLLGGCAEVLEFLKGTEWWPSPDAWDRAILFLETSEEAPSPRLLKRWLRNYATQGILHRLAGLIVGRPGGHQVPPAAFADYDQAILDIVAGELGLTDLPIVTQMDFGHTDPMFVLPLGLGATIDCDVRAFSLDESAVT